MKVANLVLILTNIISITCTHAKIGYFWHITDFHYDPLYTSQGDTRRHCRRTDERGSSGHHRALGRFGDYSCDSSLELIESAARHMRSRLSENVEFVLWTGDILAGKFMGDENDRYQAIRNMTELLSRTFSSHFVFPVLGHIDPSPSENLTNFWMHWLPLEALQTFRNGGYYTIEQSHSKLRIIALNTNLFGVRESNNVHARSQWEWLDSVLEKSVSNHEMGSRIIINCIMALEPEVGCSLCLRLVYIVGHAPPGSDTRYGHDTYSPDANAKYLRKIRKYARIIAGQFFGHLHADTFRVFYDNDRPVSWALLAPAVSPHRDPSGSSNPGLRLYKFNINSGKVLDYTQYYLDLAGANRANTAEWIAEYNLTQYYGLHDVSAQSLHNLADKLRIGAPHEMMTFNKYLRAYSLKHETSDCDGACAHQHFCSITCLEHAAYRHCVEAPASALAASQSTAKLVAPLFTTFLTLVIVIAFIC